jgi:hypothetical protein
METVDRRRLPAGSLDLADEIDYCYQEPDGLAAFNLGEIVSGQNSGLGKL